MEKDADGLAELGLVQEGIVYEIAERLHLALHGNPLARIVWQAKPHRNQAGMFVQQVGTSTPELFHFMPCEPVFQQVRCDRSLLFGKFVHLLPQSCFAFRDLRIVRWFSFSHCFYCSNYTCVELKVFS
uniref:(northern house mosquito) hypothetical protein n=1 Tax=Culex pipiens TaxID=7175 RepID=A0A8D8IL99_CULPI